ncbi:MAG: hypothetical protein ACPHID_00805 [Thermoplasmatota archaeon]
MRRAWVLLLLLPWAAAEPELTDAEGDAPRGDLLEAWYEPTSATTTDVGLRFAELGDDSLRADVTWSIQGPFDGVAEPGFGVSVWLTPSGDHARQIRTDAQGGPDLEVDVDREDGVVLVRDAWTGGRTWGGGTLVDLEVAVYATFPSDGVQPVANLVAGGLDEGGPGAARELAMGGSAATSPWAFGGEAKVTSPQELDLPGPVDLTGLWAQRNGTGFDLTAEVRSMTPAELAACETVRVFVGVGDFGADGHMAHGLFVLDVDEGWIAREYQDFDADLLRNYDTVDTLAFPYEVRWTFGTPGYFQIHAQDVVPAVMKPRVTVQCGDLDTTLRESFDFGDILEDGAPFVLPIFFATLATILGTVLVKNRQGRR